MAAREKPGGYSQETEAQSVAPERTDGENRAGNGRLGDVQAGDDRTDDKPVADSGQEAPLQLDRWLPYRLFRISVRVANLLEDHYGPRFGLTRPAWRVLSVVGETPGLSAGQIARAAGLDAFSVSRAVAHLRDLGFAQRSTARRDRRYAAVTLTEAGHAVFLDLSRLASRIEAILIDSIPADQRAAFEAVLDTLDGASAALEARGWQALVHKDRNGETTDA